jgi:hypothetical protein
MSPSKNDQLLCNKKNMKKYEKNCKKIQNKREEEGVRALAFLTTGEAARRRGEEGTAQGLWRSGISLLGQRGLPFPLAEISPALQGIVQLAQSLSPSPESAQSPSSSPSSSSSAKGSSYQPNSPSSDPASSSSSSSSSSSAPDSPADGEKPKAPVDILADNEGGALQQKGAFSVHFTPGGMGPGAKGCKVCGRTAEDVEEDRLAQEKAKNPEGSAAPSSTAAVVSALKKCAQCYSVVYCSRECQSMDWPVHKKYCRSTAAKTPTPSINATSNETQQSTVTV